MVRKLGISKKMHMINFKTEKEPKLKFFDFWAFRKKWQKLSHDKIIFHILFGAFHSTPRITYLMPEIINQNFQYWTRVMHDIQKANAVGDSVDFPIIKVSEL